MATLDSVLKSIERTFGSETVTTGDAVKKLVKVPFLASALNRMTYGGIPYGRLIEFSGTEGSGKTTTTLQLIASHQRNGNGKKAVFIDAEGTYDPEWARKLGVDNSKVLLIRPEAATAEKVLQMALDIIDSGDVGICVIDSVAALVPQQVEAKNMEEYQIGGISKSLTIFSQKVNKILAKNDCMLICINQMRDNVSGYGQPTYTPGGKAFKHFCSIRIEFKAQYIDEGGRKVPQTAENPAGIMIIAGLKKSKCFPSDRKIGEYRLFYVNGFDQSRDMVDAGIAAGILKQAGSFISFIDEETGEILFKAQGVGNFAKELPENLLTVLQTKLQMLDAE